MFLIVVSLVIYLIGCAKLSKMLENRGATPTTKQICGLIVYAVAVLPLAVFGGHDSYLIGVVMGALGYVTVAFRPRWIVGNR